MSPSREQVRHFLGGFCRWAAVQPYILAVALVGSYARNDATTDSDVDLIILLLIQRYTCVTQGGRNGLEPLAVSI